MILISKYVEDKDGVKYAPITTPNAVRWPDGSNLNDKLSGLEGVTAIVAPANATDATLPVTSLTCEVGKYYRLDVAVETLTVTLPSMSGVTTVKTVVLYLTAGTTPAVTISAADSKDVLYQDGFGIESGKTYEINALFNGAVWVVASVEIIVE
jgi:hypothetical protein